MKIKMIVHFPSDDEDCCCEYSSVSVEVDDKEVVRYGDSYHDSGRERAEAFVDAYIHIYGKENIEYSREKKADDPELS